MNNMYRHITDPNFKPTKGIGSFESDPNEGFKASLKDALESFENTYQMKPMQHMTMTMIAAIVIFCFVLKAGISESLSGLSALTAYPL